MNLSLKNNVDKFLFINKTCIDEWKMVKSSMYTVVPFLETI